MKLRIHITNEHDVVHIGTDDDDCVLFFRNTHIEIEPSCLKLLRRVEDYGVILLEFHF